MLFKLFLQFMLSSNTLMAWNQSTSTLCSCLLCKRCACTQVEREPPCARALLCWLLLVLLPCVWEALLGWCPVTLSWPHTAARWSVLKCKRCRYKSALLCCLSSSEGFVPCSSSSHLSAQAEASPQFGTQTLTQMVCVLAASKTGWTIHTWDLQTDSFLKSGS